MYGQDELQYLPHHLQLAAILGARIQVLFREMDLPKYPGVWQPLGYYMHPHPSHQYRIHPDDEASFPLASLSSILDANLLSFEFDTYTAGEPRKYRVSARCVEDKLPIRIKNGPWVRATSSYQGTVYVELMHKGRTDARPDLLAAQESGEFHMAEENSDGKSTRDCY